MVNTNLYEIKHLWTIFHKSRNQLHTSLLLYTLFTQGSHHSGKSLENFENQGKPGKLTKCLGFFFKHLYIKILLFRNPLKIITC